MPRFVISFTVVLIALLGGFFFYRNYQSKARELPLISEAPAAQEARVIEVEAGSFYFTPNLIRVKKGEKIKLILKANDLMHDFNIDELGVKVPVTKAGNSSIVEFTADKAGEFEYYCSIGEHRQRGQVGKLIVIE